MSRDFMMLPFGFEDPFTASSWYPSYRTRRGRGRGLVSNMENLWNEAMRECMRAEMENRSFGADLTDLTPWHSTVESHIEKPHDEGGEGKYLVHIPLGRNIRPEDMKCSLKNEGGLQMMTIEAKKEQKSADGNSRVYQEYTRKFTLPPNVDPSKVKSVLHDGYLKIEAPLPMIEEKEEKAIPIEMAKVG